MKSVSLRYVLLVVTTAALGLWALAVDLPHTFAPGTTISSSEVNENFAALETAINTFEGAIAIDGDNRVGIGTTSPNFRLHVVGGFLGIDDARAIIGTQGVTSCAGTYAVGGCATTGDGVFGRGGRGVFGTSSTGIGVLGVSEARGVVGTQGVTSCAGTYAVGGCATTGSAAVFRGGSGGNGTCSYNGGSGWSCTSDKNAKENFQPIDTVQILERLAATPITTWTMKGDLSGTPHLGPTAQDFYAAFGLGDDDLTINSADAQGVAFAAIQGLYQLLQERDAVIAAQQGQLAALSEQLALQQEAFDARLAALEQLFRVSSAE